MTRTADAPVINPSEEPFEGRTLNILMVLWGMLPSPRGSCGVPVVTWSMVDSLVKRGHRVSICTLSLSPEERGRDESRALLESRGVAVYELGDLPQRGKDINEAPGIVRKAYVLRRLLIPRPSDVFPGVLYVEELERILREVCPDAIYAFDFNPVMAVAGARGSTPSLAAVVNLDHVAREVRRVAFPPRSTKERLIHTIQRISERSMPMLEARGLKKFRRVVCHAAQHSRWLQEHGVICSYVPSPIVDPVGPAWQELREKVVTEGPPRVLFIGRLNSTINTPALEMLAFEILPHLERCLGPDGFVVDIVGQGDIDNAVAQALDQPYVRRRGFVENVDDEFLGATVLLVPTPSDLGSRTRVAEGFAYGCAVVSHSANALGMPHLQHESNVLLGHTGEEIAKLAARVITDPDLRNALSQEARRTFEREHEAQRICLELVKEIERITSPLTTPN